MFQVPSFLLDMIGEPDVPAADGQGCSYCGGLGHRITGKIFVSFYFTTCFCILLLSVFVFIT